MPWTHEIVDAHPVDIGRRPLGLRAPPLLRQPTRGTAADGRVAAGNEVDVRPVFGPAWQGMLESG